MGRWTSRGPPLNSLCDRALLPTAAACLHLAAKLEVRSY